MSEGKMVADQARRRYMRVLWGIFLLVLATLACESETAISMIEVTPPPQPTIEPTPENADPNYVLSLPSKIKNSSGWAFTLHRVELLTSLNTPTQDYPPTRGLYVLLIGTIGNFTDKRDCLRGQEFTLRNGSTPYKMPVEHAEAIHQTYNLSYPDYFLGQCLDADQTAESFLIFDVPREAGDLWLELGDGRARLGRMSALIQAVPPLPPSLTREVQENPRPLVTADQTNVNIRSGPGVQYAIIGRILIGQSYEIAGRNVDASWWQISTPNGLGWVAVKVTTASNTPDNIPIVEVPR